MTAPATASNAPLDPQLQRPQKIAVLPGDGIGKDVTAETVKVLAAAAERWSLPLELDPLPYDADHFLATGVSMPPGQMERFRDDYAAIFIGAYGDPRIPDMRHAADILLGIRFQLDLYINFRPVKLYDARLCPLKERREADVDFTVFRENTEGAYVGVGGNFKKGTADEVAVQEEINTRKGVERICRAAFDWAVANGKRKVLMSDKSNVMRFGHDLWQRTFFELAGDYPQIEASHMFVDALCMQLVKAPQQFEVIVANNMFGDILTDLGSALQGGLGVAASANRHPGRVSMYEPVHGSAPKYAGTGRANPMGAILSAALMLEDLGHREASREIERVVAEAIRAGETTVDLGGNLKTHEVGDRIAREVAAAAVAR
ncbi:MAG: isocitrate/isopropylmalate dehydrogenase family protein [Thermoanaerobaculia bacterium]|nr:isocitrate/isopropylmalate dehydrogenase family protein [Thermoanaerobaculia bacterium]